MYPIHESNYQREYCGLLIHKPCNTRIVLNPGTADLMARCPEWYSNFKCPCCNGYYPINEFEGVN